MTDPLDFEPAASHDSASVGREPDTGKPPSLATVPTIYPPSPLLEDVLESFWSAEHAPDDSKPTAAAGVDLDAADPAANPDAAAAPPADRDAAVARAMDLDATAAPPDRRSIIERLGPSPFERGGFPIVGFLATVYERAGQYARQRLKDRDH